MKSLTCPKCLKVMESVTQMGVELDQCGNCNGVWLDRGEWTQMTRGRGKDAVTFQVVNTKPIPDFRCPRCQAVMEEGHHHAHDDFAIDQCPSCQGCFLDRGELFRLLAR